MSLRAVEENTGWQAALEIAKERDKNVQRLCKAVNIGDYETAKLIAKELEDDEEMPGVDPRFHRSASRKR